MKKIHTRDLALIGIFAAILCVVSPFAVPVGLVPITLGTFAVYFAAASLGTVRGTTAVLVYILLGAVGVPVFSNFEGGLHKIAGPTGGYIVGYIPLALIVGLFAEKLKSLKFARYPLGMVCGTIVLYALGTAWFCVSLNRTVADAVAICVVPFLFGDAVKIAAASVLAHVTSSRIMRK